MPACGLMNTAIAVRYVAPRARDGAMLLKNGGGTGYAACPDIGEPAVLSSCKAYQPRHHASSQDSIDVVHGGRPSSLVPKRGARQRQRQTVPCASR